MRHLFVIPQSVTGFHDYFRLTPEFKEVAYELGYSFATGRQILPRHTEPLPWVNDLQERILRFQPRISLTSETARREYLIAPILLEMATHYNVTLRSEYAVNVSEQLRGTLDYLVESDRYFLIVEAKNEDLVRGTSQLIAELAAMDALTEDDIPTLYGAVSTGTIWQFARLHRAEKRMEQDLVLYRVPEEVPDICAILLGVLQPTQAIAEET